MEFVLVKVEMLFFFRLGFQPQQDFIRSTLIGTGIQVRFRNQTIYTFFE